MDSYSELYHKINDYDGYGPYTGVVVTDIQKNYAKGELVLRQDHMNTVGVVHGGCLTTLADTVTGIAAYTSAQDQICLTVGSSMNFLRAATGTKLTCISTAQKAGRTLCVFDTTVRDDQDRVVATGCFTFYKAPKAVAEQA